MATVTYQFKIGNDNISYSEKTTVKIDDVEYKLSLLSLRYFKRMYQPCKIEAKIKLTQNAENAVKVPEMPILAKYFRTGNNNVLLTKTIDKQATTIAKDYYVAAVLPEYKRSENGMYVQVTLHIYSPDHKLTLDKFCRSYTNRKFAANIVKDSLSEDDNVLKKAGFTTENVDTSHLKFLNYVSAINGDNVTYKEFVQPYLVQYNESFYDFLARTSNRCGEFLYYEDGKLYIGINDFTASGSGQSDGKTIVDIDRDKVISYSYEQADDALVGSVDFYYDSLTKKKDNDKPFCYNNELPLDEYLNSMVEKDTYTSTVQEFFPKALKSIPDFLGTLATQGIAGAAAWVISTALSGSAFAASTASTKNKKFNELWLTGNEPTNNKTNFADRNDNNSKTTLYGSLLTQATQQNNYEYQQNLNQTLYTFIGTGSKQVSGNLIKINVGDDKKPFLLGQKVTFASQKEVSSKEQQNQTNGSDKTSNTQQSVSDNLPRYIVIEVSEVIKQESANFGKEDWATGLRVVLAPLYDVKTKKMGGSTEQTFQIACPPVMCPLIRTVGTQRAFVSEAVDPQRLGRVRLKYAWQTNKDDASPFVRMAVPYVPDTGENNGGFYFQLRPDTEVLVDYEGGNVERPYVIGALYNAQAKTPRDGGTYATWSPSLHSEPPLEPLTISSLKGHKIKLDDNGSAESFLASALPAIDLSSLIWRYFWPSNWRLDKGGNSAFSGGIELTDKWGIYDIKCSTTNRSISVTSPFGNVDISAFTGINITAPNGDVNITGKNIRLQAGNELILQSGLNVHPPGYSFARDTVLKGIVNGIINKFGLPMVDFRLLRCIADIILKPVTGNMSIKSNRYLLLGAGCGKPEIPTKAYTTKGVMESTMGTKAMTLHQQLVNQCTVIDKFFDEFLEKYKLIRKRQKEYFKEIEGNVDPVPSVEEFMKATYDHSLNYTADELHFKNGTKYPIITRTTLAAKEICMRVKSLHKNTVDYFTKDGVNQIIFGINEINSAKDFKEMLEARIVSAQPPLVKNVLAKKETFTLDDTQLEGEISKQRKQVKRYLAFWLVGDTQVLEYRPKNGPNDPNLNINMKFKKLEDFDDNDSWDVWVSYLKKYSNHSAFGKFIDEIWDETKTKAANYSPLTAWKLKENEIWGPGLTGEILMSDKSGGQTINIVNGTLNRTQNADGFCKQVKDVLRLL